MGVTVVAGRAGSGKSRRCFDRIVAAMRADPLGPPIYWVVPKQATFSAERWLTCGSGLEAFSRCRVVSFDQLGDEVLAWAGGVKRPVVSKSGRLMVIGHLLRERAEELKHFKASARHPGLATELLSLLDEMGRNGASEQLPAVVASLAAQGAGDETRVLHRKLADLSLLRERYTAFMGPGRFDQESRMEHVLRHVGSCPKFRGATFYVDGFLDLLDFERRMLVALAGTAAEIEVTFCLREDSRLLDGPAVHELPEPESVFHRVELAHRALRVMLAERQIPVRVERLTPREGEGRFTTPALRAVARRAAGLDTPAVTDGENAVRLTEAADVRAEVDAAAREILRLTAAGRRFREIVMLVHDLPRYEHAVAASFREHGITHFMDRRRDASCHPLLRLVRSVLAIAVQGWTAEQVVSVCKSGLAGASVELACRLENWAITKGVRGDGWLAPHPNTEDREVEALRESVTGSLRTVVDGLRAPEGVSVRDACTRLLAMLESLGVRKTLATWMKQAEDTGDFEGRAEHVQVWREVMAFLDELAELLGDTTVRAADLQTIVVSGLEGVDLGLTPQSADCVLVGPAERTRVGDAKVVFVLGLSEGIFPAAHQTEDLLTDRERRSLRAMKVPLDPDGEQRQLDERLIGYLALTRASERLYASRPTTDAKGAPLGPGAFWTMLREVVPGAVVDRARSESDARPEDIATPRQLSVGLLRWAREPGLHDDPAWRALYAHLAGGACDGSAMETCRHAVWSALARANVARISAETAARLWPMPLTLTEDQLETFAACPFRHFAKYGLQLGELERPEVRAGTVSGVMHNVLGSICRDVVAQAGMWPDTDDEEAIRRLEALARGAVDKEVRRLTHDGSADPAKLSPRDRYLLSRAASLVRQVVRAHGAAAARTNFAPMRAAVRFGGDGPNSAPPLRVAVTVGGKAIGEATISGSIDRVDVTPGGHRVVAWDYTWSPRATGLGQMYHGLALKVLVHLMVLRDYAGEIAGGEPGAAGAFVVGLKGEVKSVSSLAEVEKAPEVSSAEYAMARRKARGLFSADDLGDLDSGLGDGRSPLFSVQRKKDGTLSEHNSDALTPAQLDALMRHAEAKIGELAGRISCGDVAIAPYRIGTKTPCPQCEYRPLCRFDPRNGGEYTRLDEVDTKAVLARLVPPVAEVTEAATGKPGAKKGGRRG